MQTDSKTFLFNLESNDNEYYVYVSVKDKSGNFEYYESNKTLAEIMGKSESTVKRYIDELVKELRKPQNMNSLVDILTNMQNKIDDTNTNLQMLIKEQKQVQNSLNNLVSAIEQGIVSKTTGTRLKELENQLETLEENIAIERNKCFDTDTPFQYNKRKIP